MSPFGQALGRCYRTAGGRLCFRFSVATASKSIVTPRPRQNPKSQKALGATIRELRTKKGVSLEALAGDAGISKNMLSLIERGEGNPSWSTVEGIAAALGITVSQLAKQAE